ncbi:glycine cleavage system aminomethyltransferase GcvT [Rhodobaculum claviforme]|uniref:aminomethyltransferase n=1 Tax=Rhodobaculum claviforme TaxID=1549854 RepID=A0A934WI21_9RHOB|nr:glycine cleavage system aminomethyltransferase GcvT [Rhodobaculum claviforme]MBK5926386.1 glycine cleavage system protein T [Rhodobaculum claviforme]
MADLQHLPLAALHAELGAKMTPFAGWEMPLQYPAGVMQEHLHCRAHAALFDVSHMGQVMLRGPGAAVALEALVGADLVGLADGRQRYAVFTDDAGGVLDDLMVARRGDDLFLVVNAANADADVAHLRAHLPAGIALEVVRDRALIALQGPQAEAALAALIPDAAALRFMDAVVLDWDGAALWVSRSGYTGEDGYEISVPVARAEAFARALLAQPGVAPAGLGARDSLRLEAGLPLHGQDIDATVSPIEAGLAFSVGRARRPGGARPGGFPGAGRILHELAHGPARARAGLLPEGRAPMRAGTLLFESEDATTPMGHVTSGGFGPSLERPVAMGLMPTRLCVPGTRVYGEVRGRRLPAVVAALPFRAPGYRK